MRNDFTTTCVSLSSRGLVVPMGRSPIDHEDGPVPFRGVVLELLRLFPDVAVNQAALADLVCRRGVYGLGRSTFEGSMAPQQRSAPSVPLMEAIAAAYGEAPDIFAEYRLTRARRLLADVLDYRKVGLARAVELQELVEAALAATPEYVAAEDEASVRIRESIRDIARRPRKHRPGTRAATRPPTRQTDRGRQGRDETPPPPPASPGDDGEQRSRRL